MTECSAGIETLSSQAPPSSAKAKIETLTQPEPQFEELISYLDTREDIAEVSVPSGGLVRVKNKDGLYNYFGSDKKLISENWFNVAKDFHEIIPESNNFVAFVGKKTDTAEIDSGINYFFIDTHGNVVEFPDSSVLPKKPIFHLGNPSTTIPSENPESFVDDEQFLTDQEIETAKMVKETKENFKGSGIVEFVEYLRDNYYLTIGGDSLIYGKDYGNKKQLQKKIDRLRKKAQPVVIGYDGMEISLYYQKYITHPNVPKPLEYPSLYERLKIIKTNQGYKLEYYPEEYYAKDNIQPLTTITSPKPDMIIKGIIKVANLGEKKKWILEK